jgi:glycine betaine/proline transport system substrate-binding protein
MISSICLWAFYPPLSNLLLDSISPFQLAMLLHSLGAISIMTLLVAFGKHHYLIGILKTNQSQRKELFLSVFGSGILIFANHSFFYYALYISYRFDVTAILIFETWPILFFLMDLFLPFKKQGYIRIRDFTFVFVTFLGFITLMSQEIDIAELILFDTKIFAVALFAGVGAIAMAANVFLRRKAMRILSSSDKGMAQDQFGVALVVEVCVRFIAALLFVGAFFVFDEHFIMLSRNQWLIAFAISALILGVGSALYDISVNTAKDATIAIMWYLMPVGALIVLSAIDGRMISKSEAIASVMIISANILINLKYPLRSSFIHLYFFSLVSGLFCVFIPPHPFEKYFALLSIASIFYVLLGTYALGRVTENTRQKKNLLTELDNSLRTIDTQNIAKSILLKIGSFLSFIISLLQGKRLGVNKKIEIHNLVTDLKNRLSREAESESENAGVLKVLSVGERIVGLQATGMRGGEYIVLILLAALNIFLMIFFRGQGVVHDLSAFTISAAAAYLLFLIIEKGRISFLQFDQYLLLMDLVNWKKNLSPMMEKKGENNAISNETIFNTAESRHGFVFSLMVFLFVFSGFTYALSYDSLFGSQIQDTSPSGISKGAKERKEIVIGVPSWTSAVVKAELIKAVGEEYLGLNVRLNSATNETIFRSMSSSRGSIHVHPEVWVANLGSLVRKYVEAFKTVKLTENGPTGSQGLCINRPAQLQGNVANIRDLEKNASLFDLDDDNKGEIWIGPSEWASSKIEITRAFAYGYSKKYDLIKFNESLFIRALARYEETNTPFLFFCYSPHYLFDKYDLKFVKEPETNTEIWKSILRAAEDKDRIPKNGTSWPQSPIRIAYSRTLIEREANFVNLLEKILVSTNDLNAMVSAVESGQPPREVVKKWIMQNQNEEIVLNWLLPSKMRLIK